MTDTTKIKTTLPTDTINAEARMDATVAAVAAECSPDHASRLRAAWADMSDVIRTSTVLPSLARSADAPVPMLASDAPMSDGRGVSFTDAQLAEWSEVARAASDEPLAWGPSAGDGAAFMLDAHSKGPAGPVHAVWFGPADDAKIVAITGNGPTSAANAKAIAWAAPRYVLALIDEVRALRSRTDHAIAWQICAAAANDGADPSLTVAAIEAAIAADVAAGHAPPALADVERFFGEDGPESAAMNAAHPAVAALLDRVMT